jgi:hypothetical protein
MVAIISPLRLKDGTLVEHKNRGYRGRIDGITEIKSCFTRGGVNPVPNTIKDAFQYRVVVTGEPMRHIAPAEDLEVLAEEIGKSVSCVNCKTVFRTKPDVTNKAHGRCDCGGWICPGCLTCRTSGTEAANENSCAKENQRVKRRQAKAKSSRRSLVAASMKRP